MGTIRSVEIDHPGAELRLTSRDVPNPGRSDVRITVEACGICHTDESFVNNVLPGLTFLVTPGHEIAGRIDAVGESVTHWQPGDRVAVG